MSHKRTTQTTKWSSSPKMIGVFAQWWFSSDIHLHLTLSNDGCDAIL